MIEMTEQERENKIIDIQKARRHMGKHAWSNNFYKSLFNYPGNLLEVYRKCMEEYAEFLKQSKTEVIVPEYTAKEIANIEEKLAEQLEREAEVTAFREQQQEQLETIAVLHSTGSEDFPTREEYDLMYPPEKEKPTRSGRRRK